VIAIDLGSNTIRFIEYDGIHWGKSFEKIIKTAESLYTTNEIGDAAVERIVGAIEEARKKLDFVAHEIIGVATAAMRMANNRNDVLESIFRRSGIRFTLIDGDKEALLTLKAVRYRLRRLGLEPSRFILSDIGGGSTELIESDHGTFRSISLDIGIVTLSESANNIQKLEQRLALFEADIRHFVGERKGYALVLTAGTPTTIAAYLNGMDYDHYDASRINGFILTLEDCRKAYRELLDMSEFSRSLYVGVGREKLIAAGILLVISIYTAVGIGEAIIVDDGLREGVALAYYDEDCHIF
jgi:exopolyphosphatase / guanosine-5'-triphosphate,3'-diphosphate pyrophosphatase